MHIEEFQPTYLYIKQHPATGLKYFGKTTGTEKYLLEDYLGSGDYWEDHLRIHGSKNIDTPWYCLFTEKEELVNFALVCSENSSDTRWSTGEIVHTSKGTKYSPEEIIKRTGKKLSESWCKNISEGHKGKKNSQFGTKYMINHTTKEKTRLHNQYVEKMMKTGWVLGNKHSYVFIKIDITQLF